MDASCRARSGSLWRLFLVLTVMACGAPVMFVSDQQSYGGDFLNVYDFHHCQYRDTPYAEAAIMCDARGWPMNYPPLLYWSFLWVRGLSFDAAYTVWALCIAAGIVGAGLVWSARTEGSERLPRAYRWLFAIGLLLSFPSGFAIVTGNNDIAVLVLWTVGWLAFARRRVFGAGLAAGLAMAYKLYAAFAIALVIPVLAFRDRKAEITFELGTLCALILQAVFAPGLVAYISGNFSRYVMLVPDPSWYSHSVPGIVNAYAREGYGFALSGLIFFAWLLAVARHRHVPTTLVFAASLAISTFFATTSYDYNLLTTFPLLAWLFVTSMTTTGARSNLLYACLLAGLFVLGNRNLTTWLDRGREWHGVLQVAWLLGVAAVLTWTAEPRETTKRQT